MKFRNIAELHNFTSEVIREAEENGYVVITSRGKPKAIIQKFSEDNFEDFIIENSPRIRKSIVAAQDDYVKNGGMSLEEVVSELKF